MKVMKMIENVIGLNQFIKKDMPVEYDLRVAITKNHKVLMLEYEIYMDAKRKIDEELEKKKKEILLDKPETEMTELELTKWTDEKQKAQKKLDKILEKEIEVDIITVSRELTKELDLSIKDQIALDFMLVDTTNESRS